jgi:hypothetical protein
MNVTVIAMQINMCGLQLAVNWDSSDYSAAGCDMRCYIK